jgi:serine protease Do
MSIVDRFREKKILPVALTVATLAIGVMIGTLIDTGVSADKSDKPVTDATPLVIPSPTQLANDFTALAKKMEPAVVYVSTVTEAKPQRAANERKRRAPQAEPEGEDEDGMELFRRFFRGPMPDGMPRGGGTGGGPQRREGTGSGFIVDPKGYIITNHHVVDGADKITVKLHGETTEYKAKLIGIDHEIDLAVIKIDAGRSLSYTPVGNSEAVQVGDWAVAIGSPFGLEASVTAGIVSAKGRNEIGQQFQSFIQTDAAINPGNSGGPLLNIKGEVIGVNTMIATQSGGYQGIGFALPINSAVKSYNQIIKSGGVTRGSIGISWNPKQVKPETLKALGASHGVIVETVTQGGPADKAGVKGEDIILAINGRDVKNGDELVARIADTPIGDKVNITVDRNGKKVDLAAVVADRAEVFKDDPRFARFRKQEEAPAAETGEAKFGIYVRPLTPEDKESMKLESDRGVVVTRVQEESFAGEIGVRENDVIVSINRQPVSGVEDIKKIQTTLKGGDAVAFRVMRPNPFAGRANSGPRFASMFLSGTLPK